MDCLTGATEDQEAGVEMATHAEYASAWNNWLVFCEYIGAADPYLCRFMEAERIRLTCAFTHAVRRGDFSPTGDPVKGDTAKKTLENVAKTIVLGGGKDPRIDATGSVSMVIQRQFRAYKKVDPKIQHQKAIPPEVYRFLLRKAKHKRQRARIELLCGALFFACRSCEYLRTQRHEEKTTRTIRPIDIEFWLNGELLPHNSPLLHMANYVIIKFGPQKADAHRDESVPQQRSEDPELNPVNHWAYTVQRLQSYPGYDPEWPVYTYFNHETGLFSDIFSHEILSDIRSAVDGIRYQVLGFTSDQVGTHSNRGGFAMMMYLSGIPIFTIMKLGRWLSDAFLRYIEQQVLTFSQGVSTKMLHSNTFFNFPVSTEQLEDTRLRARSSGHYTGHARNQVFGRHSSLRDRLASG